MEVTLENLLFAYGRIAHVSHYHILIIMVVIDIISGFGKAIVTRGLDSKIGMRGLIKHISVVALVFLCCPYIWLMGYGWIAQFLIYSIVATYGISIIENYAAMGLPLPGFIGQFFQRLKNTTDITLDDINKLNIEVDEKKFNCERKEAEREDY